MFLVTVRVDTPSKLHITSGFTMAMTSNEYSRIIHEYTTARHFWKNLYYLSIEFFSRFNFQARNKYKIHEHGSLRLNAKSA